MEVIEMAHTIAAQTFAFRSNRSWRILSFSKSRVPVKAMELINHIIPKHNNFALDLHLVVLSILSCICIKFAYNFGREPIIHWSSQKNCPFTFSYLLIQPKECPPLHKLKRLLPKSVEEPRRFHLLRTHWRQRLSSYRRQIFRTNHRFHRWRFWIPTAFLGFHWWHFRLPLTAIDMAPLLPLFLAFVLTKWKKMVENNGGACGCAKETMTMTWAFWAGKERRHMEDPFLTLEVKLHTPEFVYSNVQNILFAQIKKNKTTTKY
ncbi:hypothetical protein ACJIZ3_006747 [Penstemon smallii]|uniref:Uncharacterized protein n=1 Tax=Penstemon smallii TaxID=265156 RepID=A0ABD3S8Q7_9LAMI